MFYLHYNRDACIRKIDPDDQGRRGGSACGRPADTGARHANEESGDVAVTEGPGPYEYVFMYMRTYH
jgi:hypothetical protein